MNTQIQSALIVGALVVFVIGAYLVSDPSRRSTDTTDSQTSQSAQNPSSEQDQQGPDIDAQVPNKTFTVAEVSMHSSEDDCWTIINDIVFDITPYIPRHPGGEDILLACGQDGSTLFNARRTEEGEKIGFGDAHSQRATGQLADFAIGSLE